jgi:O-antigen/teichoic acid export membrane protein
MLMRHSMIYVLSRFAPGVLNVLTTAILTRLLNPLAYGAYGLSLVVMSLCAGIGFQWLGIAFVRFYQEHRTDPAVADTFLKVFGLLVIASAAVAAVAWQAGAIPAATVPSFGVGIVLACCYAWFELCSSFEIVNMRPVRFLIMSQARSVLTCAGALLGAWSTHSGLWTALGAGAGMLGGAAFGNPSGLTWNLRSFDRRLAVRLLHYGAPVAAAFSLMTLGVSGTRYLVEVLGSREILGFYTAAFLIIQNSLTVIGGGLASAAFPLAVRSMERGDEAETRRQLTANGALMLAVMAPATLGLMLTADGTATTFVGEQFAPAVAAITPWMAFGTFLTVIRSHMLDIAFHLSRQTAALSIVTGAATALMLALSWYWIPRDGAVGAAKALALASAVSCVHSWWSGRSRFDLPMPVREAVKVALCCLAMAAIVLVVPGVGAFRLAFQVAAGIICYGLAALAFDLLGTRSRLIVVLPRWVHRCRSFFNARSSRGELH